MPVRETLGVIGGSGLYELAGLENVRHENVTTPFGEPSDEIVVGTLGDVDLAFLPRHGRGHRLLPHEINFRANVCALKQLGARAVLSISAVGSMKETIRPGDLVVVDQFIDRTHGRVSSFFGDGVAGHIPFADPICARLAQRVFDAAVGAAAAAGHGARVHRGGTYLVINGPQFSTRAESRLYRSWGVDVIGMTNLPEARLAREAGLCYATVALATDYDCWHESEDDVSVEAILAVLGRNVATARDLVARAARTPMPRPEDGSPCGCALATRHALITDPARMPAEVKAKLRPILGDLLAPN